MIKLDNEILQNNTKCSKYISTMVNDIIKGKSHGIFIPSIYETSEPNHLSFWCNTYKPGTFRTPYNNEIFGKRWFKKGGSITIANFNDQVHLMKYATGHYYKGVAKTKETEILLKERQQIYAKWWLNDPKHKDAVTCYQDKHLKDIISRFGFMFTKETDLNLVGDELRQCLLMSNAISPDIVNQSMQITFSPIRRSNRKHNQSISDEQSSEQSLSYKRNSNDKNIIANIFLHDSNKTNSLSQPNEISSISLAPKQNDTASSDDDNIDFLPSIKIFLQNFDNSVTALEELAKIEYALSHIHSNHVLTNKIQYLI